jgi:hypothetical protein
MYLRETQGTVGTHFIALLRGIFAPSKPPAPTFPNGKEYTIMSKQTNFISRFVRWILPLLVLVLIGLYLVLAPMMNIHAASGTQHRIAAPSSTSPAASPDWVWYY